MKRVRSREPVTSVCRFGKLLPGNDDGIDDYGGGEGISYQYGSYYIESRVFWYLEIHTSSFFRDQGVKGRVETVW